MKKPSWPKVQLSKSFIFEIGPKTKKMEAKKWPTTSPIQKKLGNQFM